MDSGELQAILERHEVFHGKILGVFMRDSLPSPLLKGGYIVNTDLTEEPGTHWVALWVRDDVIEFLDSFAHPPEHYGMTFSVPVLTNTHQLQAEHSITCGAHCLYFLYFRCLELSMEQILRFFGSNLALNDVHVTKFTSLLKYLCLSYSCSTV